MSVRNDRSMAHELFELGWTNPVMVADAVAHLARCATPTSPRHSGSFACEAAHNVHATAKTALIW